MAGALERIMATIDAARDAWKTYGSSEDLAQLTTPERRRDRFAFLASLYAGTAYAGEGVGRSYRTAHQLYDGTRQITNPVKALCDFYGAHVYSGPTAPDGQLSVEGMDAALPLVTMVPGGDRAEKDLRLAFGQLSHGWWAWDTTLAHTVRQTAILGTTLTEIVDDPATGKILTSLIYPGTITDLALDSVGNVKGYTLEWIVQERGDLNLRTGRRETGRKYRYRKVVDGLFFRHYEDDELVREDANLYGFVPAVLDRHGMAWGDWGEPAIMGSQTAADEVNELWSHANDRLHQLFAAPLVVSGSGSFADQSYPSGRSSLKVFGVPAGGQVTAIDFSIGDVMTSVDHIMESVAQECPELHVYERIREMSTVTGPGLRRAVADVEHRLNGAAALYDRQRIKLLQMGAAIGGWRLNNGDWQRSVDGGRDRQLNAQQEVFRPFGLESFKDGKLDAMMLPRELVKSTLQERIDEQVALETLQNRESLVALGLPPDEIERRMSEAKAAQEAQDERDARAFNRGDELPPRVPGVTPGGTTPDPEPVAG